MSSASSSAAAGSASGKSSSSSAVPKLPSGVPKPQDGWKLFSQALAFVLSKWDLLHIAVIEEWGGRNSRKKFDHIVEDLIENCHEQWREGNDLHLDTLDVYLLECLEADFNIDFEDDSVVTEVSTIIQDVYRKCAGGDLAGAQAALDSAAAHPAMQEAKRTATNTKESDDEDEEGSSEEGEEGAGGGGSGGPRRVVDEDGWETIVAKPKKGKGGVGAGGSSGGSGAGSAAAAAAPARSGGEDAMALEPVTEEVEGMDEGGDGGELPAPSGGE